MRTPADHMGVGPILELNDIHLTLTSPAGPVKILRGAHLVVEAGATVAITGPSGAGKSTLLMVIAGLEAPQQGRIQVAGQSILTLNEDALARFRRETIGIVFQSFHLVPGMTALENIALPLDLAGQRDSLSQARTLLTAVGLAHRADHYPVQLSGGEQQRVAIARAFAAQPALVLADEPTGNLDHATGQKIIDLLFDLAQAQGTTFIMVTHDMALAGRCTQQWRMEDGLLDRVQP